MWPGFTDLALSWITVSAESRTSRAFLWEGSLPPLPAAPGEKDAVILVSLSENRRDELYVAPDVLVDYLATADPFTGDSGDSLPRSIILSLIYANGDPKGLRAAIPALDIDPWRLVSPVYSHLDVAALQKLAYAVDLGMWVRLAAASPSIPRRNRPPRVSLAPELFPDARCDTYDPLVRACLCNLRVSTAACPHPILISILAAACGPASAARLCAFFAPVSDMIADSFPVSDVYTASAPAAVEGRALRIAAPGWTLVDALLTFGSYETRTRIFSSEEAPEPARTACTLANKLTEYADAGPDDVFRGPDESVLVRNVDSFSETCARGALLYARVAAPSPPNPFVPPKSTLQTEEMARALAEAYFHRGGVAWVARTLRVLASDIPAGLRSRGFRELTGHTDAHWLYYARMLPCLFSAARIRSDTPPETIRRIAGAFAALCTFGDLLRIDPPGLAVLKKHAPLLATKGALLPREFVWKAGRPAAPAPAALVLSLLNAPARDIQSVLAGISPPADRGGSAIPPPPPRAKTYRIREDRLDPKAAMRDFFARVVALAPIRVDSPGASDVFVLRAAHWDPTGLCAVDRRVTSPLYAVAPGILNRVYAAPLTLDEIIAHTTDRDPVDFSL